VKERAHNRIRPVEVLEQTIVALEAAVLEGAEKPRKGAVHRIRTTSRRIEAQLLLLPLVGGFPPMEEEANKLRKLLKKVRKAAGKVRDLDVQQKLAEVGGHNGDELSAQDLRKFEMSGRKIGGEARRLRRKLSKRRRREANRLVEVLNSVHRKLPEGAKKLLSVLEEAQRTEVTDVRLASCVRQWYTAAVEPHWSRAEAGDPTALHSMRKAAKLARYLAETVPADGGDARRLATQFESVQQAGGEWHDWMLLAQAAQDALGDSAGLASCFEARAREALADFRHKIGYRM
jgi:CHAD domain-containing protein